MNIFYLCFKLNQGYRVACFCRKHLAFDHLPFNLLTIIYTLGSFKDPVELPGLAHFCEHMLFLGTEKYPEEEQYKTVFKIN